MHKVTFILLVIGGLNWLLIGLGGPQWDVVSKLGDNVARVVFVLVGLSALWEIFTHKKNCRMCGSGSGGNM